MAKPTSAFLSAGPSLVPSPVTATTCRCSVCVLSMMPVGWGGSVLRALGCSLGQGQHGQPRSSGGPWAGHSHLSDPCPATPPLRGSSQLRACPKLPAPSGDVRYFSSVPVCRPPWSGLLPSPAASLLSAAHGHTSSHPGQNCLPLCVLQGPLCPPGTAGFCQDVLTHHLLSGRSSHS